MEALRIRPATTADLEGINAIYNHYVLHSTCTYQTEPDTAAERAAWFAAHDGTYPVTVAEQEGDVVGWASLSRYHARRGYRHTVENSVYVRQDRHGRGIGRTLLADLIERARRIGHHTILAGISADQPASLRLHQRFGFTQAAHLREVGYKFDRWLDVITLQLILSPGGPAP